MQKVAGANVGSEIKNILKEVDRNGDGRIDYEEFCDMMRKVAATLSRWCQLTVSSCCHGVFATT